MVTPLVRGRYSATLAPTVVPARTQKRTPAGWPARRRIRFRDERPLIAKPLSAILASDGRTSIAENRRRRRRRRPRASDRLQRLLPVPRRATKAGLTARTTAPPRRTGTAGRRPVPPA